MTMRIYLIVEAIIRRGDRALLIREGEPGTEPGWVVPGGRMESGELATEALVREVREETGLVVTDPGRLAFVTQAHNAARGSHVTVFALEVAAFTGTPCPADPDGFVVEACFVPIDEACARLSRADLRARGEPLVAYLRGAVGTGAMWTYRREPGGEDELVALLPGPRVDR
jgi:8-oxo-dGTP diphosphatase